MQKFNTKLNRLKKSLLKNDDSYQAISRHAKYQKNYINLGSAGTMHTSTPKELLKELENAYNPNDLAEKILKDADSYPGLGSATFDVELDYVKFLKRWFGCEVTPEEIAVFNGIFGSYRTIVGASDRPAVLCPEIAYTRFKACLVASGKNVIEYKNTADGHIDMEDLRAKMKKWKETCSFVYINNPLGLKMDGARLSSLAKLLEKYDKFALYDLDIMYTSHPVSSDKNTKDSKGIQDAKNSRVERAYLPLLHKDFRKRAIILTTLSKEIGMPGIRFGFAVGPKELIAQIRLHQEYVLEIIPTTSRAAASLLLDHTDLKEIARELTGRMKTLVNGINQLGWNIALPATGINVYVPIPKSFQNISWASPDLAFSFLIAKTGIRVRPGSIDGETMREFVRFVIGPTIPDIKDAMQRMKKAGISFDMQAPSNLKEDYEKTIA
jgi:aspartate/methionine/tyrosine aminotransferase